MSLCWIVKLSALTSIFMFKNYFCCCCCNVLSSESYNDNPCQLHYSLTKFNPANHLCWHKKNPIYWLHKCLIYLWQIFIISLMNWLKILLKKTNCSNLLIICVCFIDQSVRNWQDMINNTCIILKEKFILCISFITEVHIISCDFVLLVKL